MKIPSKLFMSCDMGIDIETSEGLKDAHPNFDDCKHIYLCNFLLEEMEKGDSFFQPYFDTLPKDITNIPILWSNREMNYFQGSYFVWVTHFLSFSPPSCANVSLMSMPTIDECVM